MLKSHTPLDIRTLLDTRTDVTLVDVREPLEFDIARVEGAILIPLRTLPQQLDGLPRTHEIILMCHHGVRSESAGNFLLAHGYDRVSHMLGGIERWSDDVDSTVAKY
jgi:rhodanese-related sulfurtransferase